MFEHKFGGEHNAENGALHQHGTQVHDEYDEAFGGGHAGFAQEKLEYTGYGAYRVHHEDGTCHIQFGQDAEYEYAYAEAVRRFHDEHQKEDAKRGPRLVAEQRLENTIEECKQVGRTYSHDEHPDPAFFVRIFGILFVFFCFVFVLFTK